ncbi:hypothetical protein LRAMOSA08444 [Lichtheimia ramosa]|uniref:Uncharacterized protein n=1 Tax=Lichtheimia ramosa TaxID=688394 RepID=A0A077WE55_9FUNG|nr:hypothetical protein LRAMOSA08444 [Lichtheimia ramosa]
MYIIQLMYLLGFRITYPANHGENLTWGEMGYLSWEVDAEMEKSPDLITRIRLVDDIGRNTQLIGENITIRTHDNKGALVFPVNVHYFQGLQNYRIAAQHPGEAIHCVYESVPLTVIPRAYERYTNQDTAIPAFEVPNVHRIRAA